MRVRRLALVLAAAAFGLFAAHRAQAAEAFFQPLVPPTMEIPHVRGVVIDGDGVDWGDQGLKVALLAPAKGFRDADPGPVDDFDASLRIGWNETGMVLLYTVHDDVNWENPSTDTLYQSDGVEIHLLPSWNGPDTCQWAIAPGVGADGKGVRVKLYDGRGSKEIAGLPAEADAAARAIPGGYVLEVRLPFAAIGVEPTVGTELAFQTWANDMDTGDEPHPYHAAWYPGLETHFRHYNAYPVRLVETTDQAIALRMETHPFLDHVDIEVLAPAAMAGETVRVRAGDVVLAEGVLNPDDKGRAMLVTTLGELPIEGEQLELKATVDGQVVERVVVPNYSIYLAGGQWVRQNEQALGDRYRLNWPGDVMADVEGADARYRGLAAWVLNSARDEKMNESVLVNDFATLLVAFRAAAEGQADVLRREGKFWDAYYSGADGTGQLFVVALVGEMEEGASYPLIIDLHGAGQERHPNYVEKMLDLGEPYVLVQPLGRGRFVGYTGLGEQDSLSIIDHMIRWYGVDENRVYLTGGSMGGFGTWDITTCRPALFAAAAPIYGGGLGEQVENLRNVPVFNQHGQIDWICPVDLSRYPVTLLQRLGYDVLHREYPESGHGIDGGQQRAFQWLLNFTREVPRDVVWSCPGPSVGESYWLAVRKLACPHALARVKANVVGQGDSQGLSMDLSNVEVLELDLAGMPVEADKPLAVQVGLEYHTVEAPLPDRLFVVREGDGWAMKTEWQAAEPKFRPYESASAAQLYQGEPVLIVVGTQGDAAADASLRKVAEKFATFAGGWRPMETASIPVKADVDVTDEDIALCNLIVIGSPQENALAGRIEPDLPVEITADGMLKAGDHAPVALAGSRLTMVHVSPLNPGKLIYWYAFFGDLDAMPEEMWQKPSEAVIGANAAWFERPGQSDVKVVGFDKATRLAMQFTHGWRWRDLPAGDDRMTAASPMYLAGAARIARALRENAGTDYALFYGLDDGESDYLMFDPATIARMDVLASTGDLRMVQGQYTAELLKQLHEKLVAKNKTVCYPALDVEALEDGRRYTVAMPVWQTWDVDAALKTPVPHMEVLPAIQAETVVDALLAGE